MKNQSMTSSKDTPVEEAPQFLTLTSSTIRLGYGSEVFQLSNITRIGKYKVKSQNAIFILLFILSLGIAGLLFTLAAFFGSSPFVAGLIISGIAILLYFQIAKPGMFAFGFECTSGASRYIYTTDEKFIDEVLLTTAAFIENSQKDNMVINFNNKSIVDSGQKIIVGRDNNGPIFQKGN